MTRWFSLRRRLLLLILGGASACWLATLVFSYVDAHHEIDELFDAQMVQAAQTLLALSGGEDDLMPEVRRISPEFQKRIKFQIWTNDGRLVLRSPSAPPTPLAENDGFTDAKEPDGNYGQWRLYSQWNEDHSLRVQIGENHHVREELIGHIAWRLLLPAMLGLPLLGAWVWLATRRGLRPLNAVAGQIAAREPERLTPLAPPDAPEEIRPLVEAINGLFARVGTALESERRFTADAAHELRTPLAALDAQAQVALRSQDEEERRHAIEQLRIGVGRATRLVNQLLTLARLDPEKGLHAQPVPLHQLAEEVCAAQGALALMRNVNLELESSSATVPGDPDMLRIMLRNLVDNAVRYSPAGGRVIVAVAKNILTVTDTGPGIPATEREQVFDRFHRLAGQDTEGSGLGLSIVARIAELHRARIELADGEGGNGLRVRITFAET
jgi:two-component system sensor histidine kinase QseC